MPPSSLNSHRPSARRRMYFSFALTVLVDVLPDTATMPRSALDSVGGGFLVSCAWSAEVTAKRGSARRLQRRSEGRRIRGPIECGWYSHGEAGRHATK